MAYIEEGLWLCVHREGTYFSGCMWLMLRGGLCLCDHREGTNFSRCMWLMLIWVCDCLITGRELISVDVGGLC